MSTQRLLPYSSGSPSQAAYSIRLSHDFQSLLSRNEGRIRLIVSKGEVSLKVDGVVYKMESSSSPPLDIYQQLTKTSLKNIGVVSQRLEPTSPISSPLNNPQQETVVTGHKSKNRSPTYTHERSNSNTSVTNSHITTAPKLSPASRKLVQWLALGPLSKRDIVQATKLSTQEVESALKPVAMLYEGNERQVITTYPHFKESSSKEPLFVLNYSAYKEIKLIGYKYTDSELDVIRKNCQLAYDYLKYPETHPAREYLARSWKEQPHTPESPESSSSSSASVKSQSSKSSTSAKVSKANTPISSKSTTRQPSNATSTASATTTKDMTKPRTTPLSLEKKRKREDSNDEVYYLDLARRFQEKYKEYEELYKKIQSSKGKNAEGLKRLYDLHKSLESWKKQLWNSVS